MKDRDAKISKVLKRFNFGRVMVFMEDAKWKWACPDAHWRVPTEAELREEAERLLRKVADMGKGGVVACGGLVAERLPQKHLRLSFVVTSSDSLPFQ